MHLAAIVDRNIFTNNEAFLREVITDFIGQAGFVVIVESPTAARPMNESSMLVRLAWTLAYDPACFSMLPPELYIDAVLGIERRHDNVGHLRIAFWMTGPSGQRETELPELRRERCIEDRLSRGLVHVGNAPLDCVWREANASSVINVFRCWRSQAQSWIAAYVEMPAEGNIGDNISTFRNVEQLSIAP
jgi:hypothetical protein